jgi:predicted alpha/beta superfamily hydrolase
MEIGAVNLLGPFDVPGLAPRQVRVYLPRSYDAARPSLALYLFDGQNVFEDLPSFSGGWHVHEAVERLARSKRWPAPVVIGIDHGGPGRILELSPFPVEAEPGKAALLLDWITTGLMPELNAELNLVPGPLGVVIGGSSMGGLAALWAHFHYPASFGGALAMSPSLWIATHAIFKDIAGQPTPEVTRIYLDAGAREAKGQVAAAAGTMVEHLIERGYDSDRLMWRADAKGTHSEAHWRRRLPKALRFMVQA